MNKRSFLKKLFFFTVMISILGLFSCKKIAKKGNSPEEDLGVNIGLITYSFRTMPDQSPLAILEYVKKTNMKHVELMGNHAESFAGSPKSPLSEPVKRSVFMKQRRKIQLTDEEQKIASQIAEEIKVYNNEVALWRKEAPMSKFEELRKLYNDAGVSIYAFKPRVFGKDNTDDDIRYGMRAAKALGASHVTLEHPSDDKHTARLGKIAEEEGILIGYHGHEQQTPTLWDTAISQSNNNRLNLDLGHYVAAENTDPLQILKDKHHKIVSMHLKDRQKLSNGGDNLIWGTGDTPITEALQLIKKEGYSFYVTIELEYEIPEGSDAVQEVKNCLAYVKKALE
ncbi:MAG: TIM barrel protein [Bacteroidota bacterium]|nr:TIM barrel protein [Bacteroidota bacterium]